MNERLYYKSDWQQMTRSVHLLQLQLKQWRKQEKITIQVRLQQQHLAVCLQQVAMMGTMMKGDKDILTLQIKAGGPLEGITVTADSKGRVKGYVGNPNVCIPANSKGKLDVAGAVGVGFMNVIKDMGLKEPYVGQVALQTSEDCRRHYLLFCNK